MHRQMRASALAVVAATVALALGAIVAWGAPAAHASFGFVPGSASAETLDAGGDALTQAGAAPFEAITSFELHSTMTQGTDGKYRTLPDDNVKDITVDLPAGLVGNPKATPQCPRSVLAIAATLFDVCPASTQVGTVDLTFGNGSGAADAASSTGHQQYPVYNMVPRKGDLADFTFVVFAFGGTHIIASIRAGDYGIRTDIGKISTVFPLIATKLTLWGVPADPAHDALRGYMNIGGITLGGNQPSAAAPRAFLRLPSVCDGSRPVTHMRADSWQHPGVWETTQTDSPPVTGCGRLSFTPSLDAVPVSRRAGAPTGLDVRIALPQNDDPKGLGSPPLKRAEVTLPEGMAINPASADGLAACADDQLRLGSDQPVACPAASKIGTVEAVSPVLDTPLSGGIYLRTQASKDPESGQMFRIALVLENAERGLSIRLPGAIRADAQTGRLVTVFDDNPQLPVSTIGLHFKGGARAPLVNPSRCGTFQTHSVLTSWSGQTATSDSPMTIDQGCDDAGAFRPSLTAGATNPVAGASSPFVLRFDRGAGGQELGAVNGSLPPGLLGVLASVPLCSAAQGAAGTCPAASRVGHAQVAAGTGAQPLWLPVAGRPENTVSLTEPYRPGDVAGLSIVVPAVAGPFDLGTVVTKVYLKLRDEDQGIDMQSDRLPRIVGGVPVELHEVRVVLDRDGFMVNPTNCAAMATYANVFSQAWAKVPVTSRFEVGGCASLAFSPIITAQAGGKGNTKRYRHSALKVSIRQAAGQAHLSKADVVLPKKLNIDLKAPALKASCPRDVYAQDKCSPVATVGTVRAVTPLLREPLVGPAFLIQKKGQLPDIVMRLRNDRMSLDLIGVLDFLKDGRLITRVRGIPDAALSSFVLQIEGGKGGSLLNRSDLCAHKRLTKATFQGQNGKVSRKTPVTRISGCASKASASRAASRRAARSATARASAARGAHASSLHSRAAGGRS